jgi:molecular chaperone HscA
VATAKGLQDEQFANLTPDEQAEISAAETHLRETMKGEDHRAIRDGIERLSRATQHLAELIMNSAMERAMKDKRVREIQ